MRLGSVLLCGSMFALLPAAAQAGDKVLEEAAPAWVSESTIDPDTIKGGPAELLADYQHRIERGVVYSYFDGAMRIDNPQTLMDQNTISLSWLPDKGDLTVHRLEIYRDGKVIDLKADGADFDVIRREQGLEARLLDGELTATLSVPGLQVGDVLRTSYTVSTADQALGDEVQVLQYLGSKPWRVGMGRAIVSWPEGEQMFWAAEDNAGLGEPVLRGGYRYLTVGLPLAETKDMPADAPSRYHRPAILRVGSFDGWEELSRVMAPHFLSAAQVDGGSEVAQQAAAIMKKTADPLERTALAVRLVQDEISYLLDGLDGGNYLPQAAEDTWEKRYGDCKAKTVLLLALLQQMGIEAEPTLVVSRGGDALPYLLPIPGDFDHVIVRATIAGTEYWLDGTSTGTRLYNIGDVPAFFHALPLRTAGASLMPMAQRAKQGPDMQLSGTVDQSAGVDFPQLFTVEMEMNGAFGAGMQSIVDQDDPDLLRRLATSFANSSGIEGGVLRSVSVTYDKDKASGRLTLEGIANTGFQWEDGKLIIAVDDNASDIGFNPNRARPEWRDIPVQTQGPMFMRFDQTMILPLEGKGFSLEGPTDRDTGFANTSVTSKTTLQGKVVHSVAEVRQTLGEIAPADVAEAKRQARRFTAEATELIAPSEVTWRWDLSETERQKRADPIISAYDEAIEFAREDDYNPLIQKAIFLSTIYEYEDALAAMDELLEKSPSSWSHLQRSGVLLALGRRDDAIADIEEAYDLDPSNYTGFSLAREMAYAGRADEALELLDSLPVSEDERIDYTDAWVTVAGLQGETSLALSMLEEEVADKPENSQILNSDCWFRGLFNVAVEDAVKGCTRAVERSDNAAFALDSRAMVQFRLGEYDAAIADLNAALALSPALAPSRYMRGVVRLKKGDRAGQEDIDVALRMSPQLGDYFSRHGVVPGT